MGLAAFLVPLASAAPALAGAASLAPAVEGLAESVAETDVAEPDVAEPDAIEPDVAETDVAETDVAEPDVAEPDDDATGEANDADAEETAPDPAASEAPRPPRIDGVYVGGTLFGGLGLVRVNDFATDGPFAALGATAGVGQMVFPWLGLGLHGGGGAAVRSEQGARQRLGQGYLGVQFKFMPLPARQLPLTLLASFGFGGGAVRQAGITKRSGFGGAQFGAAVRYELFPWAAKRKPFRAGGLALGPELGWIGFTPAAAGRPMSNIFYLAIATTYYFGS